MPELKLLIIITCVFISACSRNASISNIPMLQVTNSTNLQEVKARKTKKLQLTYSYKQIELTSQNRKKLLYLYDWQQGVIVNFGQAKAKNEYTALSLGHQRVQHLKRYFKKQKVVAVNFDPSLPKDTLLLMESSPSPVIANRP